MNLKLATIDDLKIHEKELLQIISNSINENHRNLPNYNEFIVYKKLITYFEQRKTNVWIALDDEKIVGYAQFFLNEKGRIHLNEIAVSKDYQHKGVGTKLLNAVESSSFDLGADTIELFCNEDNEVAKKFYENNKYSTEKRLLIKKV